VYEIGENYYVTLNDECMEKVPQVKDKLKTLNNRSQKKRVTFGGSIVNVKDVSILFGGSIVMAQGGIFRGRISFIYPGTATSCRLCSLLMVSFKSVVRPPAASANPQ